MDKKRADQYLQVLVSAYAWVASADGIVDEAELHKYEHTIVQSQFATQFEIENIRIYFKDMVALFSDNFDAAVNLTKTRLKEIKGQKHLTEEVIRICRAAIVGDGKIEQAEEAALAEITKILGLESDF